MSKLVENMNDMHCVLNKLSDIARAAEHLETHCDDNLMCSLKRVFADLSADIYIDMQRLAPDLAERMGPPPGYKCFCGLHQSDYPELSA